MKLTKKILKKLEKVNKGDLKNKRGGLAAVQRSKAVATAIEKAKDMKDSGLLDMKSLKSFAEGVTQELIDKGQVKIDDFNKLSLKEKLALKMFSRKIKKAEKEETKNADKEKDKE